jgi:protein TonB
MMAALIYLGEGLRKHAPTPVVASFVISQASGGEEAGQVKAAPTLPEQRAEARPTAPAAAELPPPLVQLPAVPPAMPAGSAPVDDPPAPEATLAQAATAAPPAAASEPAPASREQPRKGTPDGLDPNISAGNGRSYAAKVRSWLYANRIYPKRARMRHEEGVVRVRFILDRQGNLLEGGLIGGSGVPALDEEGVAVLSRASPFPAAPREIPGERIEFIVPIEFVLPL